MSNYSNGSADRATFMLQLQIPGYLAWIGLCVVGIQLNVFLLFVMLSTSHLRTSKHLLILAVFINELILMILWLATCVRKIYLGLHYLSESTTQFNCMAVMASISGSMFSCGLMMSSITFDRMLAVCIPHWYKLNNKTMKLTMVIAGPTLAIALTTIGLMEADRQLKVETCGFYTLPKRYGNVISVVQNFVAVSVLVFSLVTFAVLLKRYRKHVQLNTNRNAFRRDMDVYLLTRIGVLVVTFLVFQGTGSSVGSAIRESSLSDELKSKLSPMPGVLYVLRPLFDCIAYICFCKEYRDASRALVARRCCWIRHRESLTQIDPVYSTNQN